MSEAFGTIETIGFVVAVAAADAAAKSANVRLLGAENAKGGGRVTIKLVGDVGAVKAAVAAGIAAAERIGKVAAWQVIPRPHVEIEARARLADLGAAKVKPAAPTRAAPAAPVVTGAAEPDPEPEPAAEVVIPPAEASVPPVAEPVPPPVPPVTPTPTPPRPSAPGRGKWPKGRR